MIQLVAVCSSVWLSGVRPAPRELTEHTTPSSLCCWWTCSGVCCLLKNNQEICSAIPSVLVGTDVFSQPAGRGTACWLRNSPLFISFRFLNNVGVVVFKWEIKVEVVDLFHIQCAAELMPVKRPITIQYPRCILYTLHHDWLSC